VIKLEGKRTYPHQRRQPRMYSYQQEAIEWMDIREQDRVTPGGFLCHEMGLGKTHIMCALIRSRLVRRTIVLTTKSTIESWASTLREHSNFAFDVRTKIEELPAARPLVLVVTHQSVLRNHEWLEAQFFDRVVVDEAHIMRNRSKTFFKMRNLAAIARFRWGITATPFNNRDSDMIPYMMFLRPTDDRVKAVAFKHYFLRKLRADVLPVGPKLTMTKMVYSFESVEEQRLYDYVAGRIDDTNRWIAQNQRLIPWRQQGSMMLTMLMRQRQAAIHPQLVLNSEKVWAAQLPGDIEVGDWDPTKVTKANKILELTRDDVLHGRSTMVVTHFKDEIRLLKDRFTAAGMEVDILDGSTTKAARRLLETKPTVSLPHSELSKILENHVPEDVAKNVLSFLQPTVLLLQIQAGGVGISLPWVHHVINAAPDWNPFLEKQSIFRAYRINTKHDVHVTSMYFRDTIDITIQEKQKAKLEQSLVWLGDPEESIHDFVAMP